jgi:N-acyl-D-amino-acid deacylase
MVADLLIRSATIYDGENPPYVGDVAVVGDAIRAVAKELTVEGAKETINAHGLILCPGFIDMHAHSGLRPFADASLYPKIAQGFTVEVINPDGLAPAPVRPEQVADRKAYLRALEGDGPRYWLWESYLEYLESLDACNPTTIMIPSVPHNALRDYVMGLENRKASKKELDDMCRLAEEAFQVGAKTLSLGLIYLPGVYSDIDELTKLAKVAARYDAPVMPHIRNEASGVLEAISEMIEVCKRSGAKLHVSHLKVVGNAHLSDKLLQTIDEASNHIEISFDQYPYGAGCTVLSALLPPWAQAGGPKAMLERVRASDDARKIKRDIEEGLPGWENLYKSCAPENIVITEAAPPYEWAVGKTLSSIAQQADLEPVDLILDMLLKTELNVAMVDHYSSEDVVRKIFSHPFAMVGSDAIFNSKPHPRLYGTAARVLGRYALREKIIPVEQAVNRLTSKPAKLLKLKDRGVIKEGAKADLVLLDPNTYIDRATYDEPCVPPSGVYMVMINGKRVIDRGEFLSEYPGGVLYTPLANGEDKK